MMVPMSDPAPWRQRAGSAALWGVAVVVAVTIGVAAVTGLGDQVRNRGPLGDNELVREAGQRTGPATPDPGDPEFEETFSDDFGKFVVACRGKYAIGVETLPNTAAGWRTVSYEPGPDDDIDAVFSNGRRTQELEIYCNQGRPVLAEIENNAIPDDD